MRLPHRMESGVKADLFHYNLFLQLKSFTIYLLSEKKKRKKKKTVRDYNWKIKTQCAYASSDPLWKPDGLRIPQSRTDSTTWARTQPPIRRRPTKIDLITFILTAIQLKNTQSGNVFTYIHEDSHRKYIKNKRKNTDLKRKFSFEATICGKY